MPKKTFIIRTFTIPISNAKIVTFLSELSDFFCFFYIKNYKNEDIGHANAIFFDIKGRERWIINIWIRLWKRIGWYIMIFLHQGCMLLAGKYSVLHATPVLYTYSTIKITNMTIK